MYDLYACNPRDTARYILGKKGRRKLIVIGLNPSTANATKADVTVAKVERVAAASGFDGFVMANLYPQRSTQPDGLHRRVNTTLYHENIQRIVAAACSETEPVFWAAWGGDISKRTYLWRALVELHAQLVPLNAKWLHYGELRKDGHPRHPSRLAYAWSFSEFDLNSYLHEAGFL